jgi:hypothetical protein
MEKKIQEVAYQECQKWKFKNIQLKKEKNNNIVIPKKLCKWKREP